MLVRILHDKFRTSRYTQLELLTPECMLRDILIFQSKTKDYKLLYNPETTLYSLMITDKSTRMLLEVLQNTYFFYLINKINVPDESY